MNKPTPNEKKQFKSGSPFKVKLGFLNGIIFFLLKFGNLPWMDAPYSAHLSVINRNFTYLASTPQGTGYATTIILVDTNRDEICSSRLLSFPNKESKQLSDLIRMQMLTTQVFNINEYSKNLSKIYNSLSTYDLLNIASRAQ